MKLLPEILAQTDALQRIRHDIHAHPEVGYEVHRTADLVASQLESYGIAVTRGVGRTGLVGTLKRGTGTKSIGLRADMDALPMQESNTFAHRSTNQNAMHACGHDGHTTMLLGAAQYLATHGDFDGTVQFFFQPAEEAGAGAQAMVDDGLFTRFPVDNVFGVHNWPGIPTGHFGVRPGAIMASTSSFRITLSGAGCHAAMPHTGRDPVFATAQLVSALQGVISRNKNPIESAVLSVTQMHAGEVNNVVPTDAWVGGTVRTFSDAMIDMIERRVRLIAQNVAAAFECDATVQFDREYPPTINDAAQTAFAVEAMRAVVGDAAVNAEVEPTMAAEDFSFMLRAKPGCYAFLGNGTGDHRDVGHGGGPCLLHNASYDFNDALLPVGASYFVTLVQRYLTR